MRRFMLAYVLGLLTLPGLAWHYGPEAVVQVGLRYAAASTHYAWDSAPERVYVTEADYIEPEKPKGKKR